MKDLENICPILIAKNQNISFGKRHIDCSNCPVSKCIVDCKKLTTFDHYIHDTIIELLTISAFIHDNSQKLSELLK